MNIYSKIGLLIIWSCLIVSFQSQAIVKSEIKTDGAQYLIITLDNQEIQNKLEELANFRRDQGISTIVISTEEIGGATVEQIDYYIKDAYYSWNIPPIAIMLVGDNNKIPSHFYSGSRKNKNDISDNLYADVNGDNLPDITISRLPINDPLILENFIDKLINFETNPPTNPGYYLNPVTSMGWYSNSDNMILAEATNGFFSNILEKESIRINSIFYGTPGNSWECNPLYVEFFGSDGTGYVPETPAYLSDWSGNAVQINTALNNGSFFITNLDNGTEYGWSAPEYWTDDLYELLYAEPFFVFSINNLNGKFNWSFDVFAEAIIKNPNGAMGVIASTMNLDPDLPGIYYISLLDALWENFLPNVSQLNSFDHYSLPAFANSAAKYSLNNYPNAEKTIFSFHYFGEPFCPIIYETPTEMEIFHAETFDEELNYFEVSSPENALICLSVNHQILSIEPGTGSVVSMPVNGLTCNDTLLVTVTKQNHFRYSQEIYCLETAVSNLLNSLSFQVDIFPNPVSGKLNIAGLKDISDDNFTIQLYNFQGKTMDDIEIPDQSNSIEMNVSKLKSGLYYLQIINNGNTVEMLKFIKQ